MAEFPVNILRFAARGTPGATAGQVKVYAKNALGVAQLHAQVSNGTEYQLTPVGEVPPGSLDFDQLDTLYTTGGDYTIPNVMAPAVSSLFEPGRDAFTVEANSTYIFRFSHHAATGTLAVNFNLLFGGTASIPTISWTAWHPTPGAFQSSPVTVFVETALPTLIGNINSSFDRFLFAEGRFTTGTGGTFIPQVRTNGLPGITVDVYGESYCEIRRLGADTFVKQGAWA